MPMFANSRRYAKHAARYARHSPTAPQSITSLAAMTCARSQARPWVLAFCNNDITRTISDIPTAYRKDFRQRQTVRHFFIRNTPDPDLPKPILYKGLPTRIWQSIDRFFIRLDTRPHTTTALSHRPDNYAGQPWFGVTLASCLRLRPVGANLI